MLGVYITPEERPAAAEFFELFKIPWEFYRDGVDYDALLCTIEPPDRSRASMVIGFSSRPWAMDERFEMKCEPCARRTVTMHWKKLRIPLYGKVASVRARSGSGLAESEAGEPLAGLENRGPFHYVRVGYDLFHEVRFLIREGQPSGCAHAPTLDSHIAFLRWHLVACGWSLVEIPPVLPGFQFMACLTHDIDFADLRREGFGHTTRGFLWRAIFGSIRRWCTGRLSFAEMLENWKAAAQLPGILLGWARDIWNPFQQYLQFERPFRATYFVIPFKGRPGQQVRQAHPERRATRYDAADVSSEIRQVNEGGGEIAVHGIDSWLSAEGAWRERERLAAVLGTFPEGVRMHWLCFNADSPRLLERAGFSYDSTFGYNDTVGYRAGTLQAYRPLGCATLLELPLHIQDVAMFYPGSMDLRPAEALRICRRMIQEARMFGGVLTFLWHCRSLAPERLWNRVYRQLIDDLNSENVWIAPASEIVAWFRWRRSVAIKSCDIADGAARIGIEATGDCARQPLAIRWYLRTGDQDTIVPEFVEVAWDGQPEIAIRRREKFVLPSPMPQTKLFESAAV
jgi:hypothetical protein